MINMTRLSNDKQQVVVGVSALAALTYYLYKHYWPKYPYDRPIFRGMDYPSFIRTVSPDIFEAHTDYGKWGMNQDAVPKHLLVSEEQCERALTSNVARHDLSAGRGGQGGRVRVERWEVAEVASNKPNEDAWAVDVIPKDLLGKLREEGENVWKVWAEVQGRIEERRGEDAERLMLFSMIDGHGGAAVAQVVKRGLHVKLAQSLARLEEAGVDDEGKVIQVIKDRRASLYSIQESS